MVVAYRTRPGLDVIFVKIVFGTAEETHMTTKFKFRYPSDWTLDAIREYDHNIECGETHECAYYRASVVQSESYQTEAGAPW